MRKGFTLIELLIYSAIFAIIAVVLIYFLTAFFRVSNQQIGSSEVANQANFILQKIQNEIARASFAVVNDAGDDETDDSLGTARARLIIKDRSEETGPNSDAKSPISIYKSGTNIVRKQGNQAETVLNNATVKVTGLTFKKVSTPPGKDVIMIDLTLQYNSSSPQQQITRQFLLGVGKAEAAIFDTPLTPGATNAIDIGTGNLKWKTLFLSGDLNLDGKMIWGASPDNIIDVIKQSTISIDPDNLGAGTSGTKTFPIADVQSGDKIFLTPPSTLEDGLIFTGATANNGGTVDIRIRNVSAGAINGTARPWSYLILR